MSDADLIAQMWALAERPKDDAARDTMGELLALVREHDKAELEALRADAAMHKRAVEVLFEDDSGDLDYIKWYISTNVLKARKGAAFDLLHMDDTAGWDAIIDAARGKE